MTKRRRTLPAVVITTSLVLVVSAPGVARGQADATVPEAPTITAVTQTGRTLTVAFTPPTDDGGAAISHYRARCLSMDGGTKRIGFSRRSPIIVGNVTAAKAYACTVAASNRVGTGPDSAPVAAGGGSGRGTTCTTASGTSTFTPALPKLGTKAVVDAVLTMSGTVGKCTGSVTSGTTSSTSTTTDGLNCTVVAAGRLPPILSTLTITWNTGATSTLALVSAQVKGKITETLLSGKVTAGLFQGLRLSAATEFRVPAGVCTRLDLSDLTYVEVEAFSIG